MSMVVGLFRFWDNAASAIDALTTGGYNADQVSVVMLEDVVRENPARRGDRGAAAPLDIAESTRSGGEGTAETLAFRRPLLMPGTGRVVATGALASTDPVSPGRADLRRDAAEVRMDEDDKTLPGAGREFKADDEDDLFASLQRAGVPPEMAEVYAEGVKRGGILIAVEAADTAQARHLMLQSNAADVNALRKEWMSAGWSGFDRALEAERDYPRWGRRT